MEGSQLFTCFASQTQWQTPSLSFQKNIPSVVHFYPNRWSMLVLSEPSQGGEMWQKKGEVVYLWCDLSTQENTVCVCHGNRHNGKKVYCLLQATVNTFLFVCRHTSKRLATQDCHHDIVADSFKMRLRTFGIFCPILNIYSLDTVQ